MTGVTAADRTYGTHNAVVFIPRRFNCEHIRPALARSVYDFSTGKACVEKACLKVCGSSHHTLSLQQYVHDESRLTDFVNIGFITAVQFLHIHCCK